MGVAMANRVLAVGLSVTLLSACAIGPDYIRPDNKLPESWRLASVDRAAPSDAGQSGDIRSSWWEAFGDPQLNALIAEALQQNTDVQAAAARVERFYARYGVARADFFPQLGLNASYDRFRNSTNAFSGSATVPTGSQGRILNDYQLFGGLNWELDVWGRIRRSSEAARADLLSQEAGRRAVILSVVSGVAQSYTDLREFDKRLAITKGTLTSRQQSLKLAQDRFHAGTSSELDVRQAESDLYAVQALIPALESQVVAAENRLSVLLGRNPGEVMRGKTVDELLGNLSLPSALPASLLDARPDVVQAEEQLRAANARIGVAKAAYFPRLSLTGLFGYVSRDLSDWLRSPSEQWSFGPDVSAPIFQGGRIQAGVRIARAQTQEAVSQYRQTILTALQEVEDAITGFHKSREQISAQSQQVHSLQRYLQLSQQRYDEGQSSYLEVLDAQRNLLNAELSLSQTQGLELARYINLFRALGGSWVEGASGQAVQPDSGAGDLF